MNKKPLVQQGWIRALLFVLLGLPASLFIAFGIDVATNGMYAYDYAKGSVDIISFLEDYVLKNAGFILMVWIFRTFIDKQSFSSLGFAWKGFQIDAWTGFFAALMILFLGSMILVANQNLFFTNAFFDPKNISAGVLLFVIVAFIEEIVFRGYLLNNLLESLHHGWALILTAALFAFMHLQNNNVTVLSIVNLFLAGLVLGINYVYTRNLWFAIFFHFAWNFFQGSVLGYKVSGIEAGAGIMQQNLSGDTMLTGGAFGFEGSVICTILLSVMFIIFAWRFSKKINYDTEEE
jgi:hypothetical protein